MWLRLDLKGHGLSPHLTGCEKYRLTASVPGENRVPSGAETGGDWRALRQAEAVPFRNREILRITLPVRPL